MFYARWTRKGVPVAMLFVDRMQPYVAEWVSTEQHRWGRSDTGCCRLLAGGT
jgi:hypothetical protein